MGLYTGAATMEKTIWSFLNKLKIVRAASKLKIELPYDPAISLLGIYLEKTKTLNPKDTFTPVFTVTLFTVTKTEKQPTGPLTDEWMKNTWYIDTIKCSVQFSHSGMSDSLWPHESQHARLPCPSQTPGVYSNSCPLSWWCHPAISSSVIPFSSCPQPLPA